jgi:hypothetical protein
MGGGAGLGQPSPGQARPGKSFIFGGEFSHFFDLENMNSTHTKDFCEKKWQ